MVFNEVRAVLGILRHVVDIGKICRNDDMTSDV